MYFVIFMWNALPVLKGISRTYGPQAIITGQEIDYLRHCILEFGDYVHNHKEHDNTMTPQSIGAIALRPSGNAHGGYLFLSLSTGRVITRNKWKIHRMARQG